MNIKNLIQSEYLEIIQELHIDDDAGSNYSQLIIKYRNSDVLFNVTTWSPDDVGKDAGLSVQLPVPASLRDLYGDDYTDVITQGRYLAIEISHVCDSSIEGDFNSYIRCHCAYKQKFHMGERQSVLIDFQLKKEIQKAIAETIEKFKDFLLPTKLVIEKAPS